MKTDYFSAKNAAEIYAKGRPYVHDQIIQLMRVFMNLEKPAVRALDVACGTGLSTVALKEIVNSIIALDISYDMVAIAPQNRNIYYINAAAENLPLTVTSFDLVTVSSAFHWFNKKQFIKELSRVLKSDGWVIIYENHFTGNLEDCPEFKQWFREVYVTRYPTPSRDYTINNENFKNVGILFRGEESYENTVTFTPEQFVNYQLTITSIISAVESGRDTYDGIANWMRKELKQFPALHTEGSSSGKGKFLFAGLINYFQKRA